ncbi:MAG: recombinase family protein [Gammaproteobacteria bacterium]|nr:recombinase family protein [Gammaproteobacteria bacterium]
MAKIGYARVSTRDQNLDSQRDQLKAVGCERIYEETYTGSRKGDRAELEAMLAYLRPKDVVVVTKLDRLGRSLRDLLDLVEEINEKGAHLQSLGESVDTSNESGRVLVQIMGMLAEFERNRIRERTLEGLEAARARGRVGGRPPRFNAKQRQLVVRLREEGQSLRQIAKLLDASVGTIVRAIEKETATSGGQMAQGT